MRETSHHSLRSAISVALWIAALSCWPNTAQSAQPDASSTADRPIASQARDSSSGTATDTRRYQRLLVPADHPEDWPRDLSEHYLPIPAEEFEARIARLRQASLNRTPGPVELVQASYSAELDAGRTLRGTLDWKFTRQGEAPITLPLGDCRLSLANFKWIEGSPSTSEKSAQPAESSLPAVVGNDQNGQLNALVDRAGRMRGSWSADGHRDPDGTIVFALQLANCSLNDLQLTLPEGLTPTTDCGMVSAVDGPEADRRRWRIELGGNDRTTLRIAKESAPLHTTAKTFVRQSMRYEFTPHGLELTAEFHLNVVGNPLREIKFAVDQSLVVVRAQSGNSELPVSMVKNIAASQDNIQELELGFPEPLRGSNVVVRLNAIAPMKFDNKWSLPLLRMQDSDWETGKADLIVPASLSVDELVTKDCGQTGSEQSPVPNPGEEIHLALFNERPEIAIRLSRARQQLRVIAGTSVSLRANEGTGRFVCEFNVDQGELFSLDGEIAPQWIIEDVESIPAGLVADWSQQLTPGGAGKLKVQLAAPITPQHKLQLSLTGRRRNAPWREAVHTDDLAMVAFPNAVVSRHVISVQAAENYQLQLRGSTQLSRLDSAHLAAADAALLDETPSGLVFVDDDNSQNLAVSLAGKAPQYDATIESEAFVGDDRLTETYRFSITPQGRELGRFNLRFSQLRNTPITWSMEDQPGATVTARRLNESESSVLTWPGDVWEIVLPTPQADPFVLTASRTTPVSDDMPLALASLIDAQTQSGTIQITSVAHDLPEIHSRRLKSIPIEPPAGNQYATTLAAFRYEPEEDTLLTADPPLVVLPHGSGTPLAQAWIWQATLESRLNRGGVDNVLTCKLENAGQERLQFQAPTGAELRAAFVDGQQIKDLGADASVWKIALPADKRFSTIVLCWNDKQSVPDTLSSYTAQWPAVDVQTLSRHWTVLAPPGATLADAQIGNSHITEVPWTRRLFGPLARIADTNMARFRASKTEPQPAIPVGQESKESGTKPQQTFAEGNPATPQPAILRSPWSDGTGPNASDDIGWDRYQFEGSAPGDRVWIADKQSLWSWTWSLFLIVTAARWWLGIRPLSVDIGLLGTATLIALWIAAPWTPFSAAIWLGLIGGLLMAWITEWLRSRNTAAQRMDKKAAKSELLKGIAVAVMLMAFVRRDVALAQDGANGLETPHANKASVRKVLVPVDKEGQPSGGLYYLSQAFHDELVQSTGNSLAAAPYLITRAVYTAGPNDQSKAADQQTGDWQAEFEIHSLAEQVELKLPLGFAGAALVPDGIKLDGQPAEFRSDDRHQNLMVDLKDQGTHRLDVVFHPAAYPSGLNFATPRVANSQIDLSGLKASQYTLGTKSENADVDSRSINPNNAIAILGPADRIVLRKPENSVAAAAPPVFDIDELYWLRFRPDSIVLNSRFHLNVQSGNVQQLYLQADSRWRPLTVAEHAANPDQVAVREVRRLLGNSDTWLIELAKPVIGQATVDVAFQLDTDSGIGQWQLRRCSVRGAKTERRWWALTVAPSLKFTRSETSGEQASLAEQFATLWPSRDEKPRIAWQADAEENPPSIAIWPQEPKLTALYDLVTIAAEKSMDVRLAAHVTATEGDVFQFRLRVPPQIEIDDVSLADSEIVQPTRWARSGDVVTLFLSSPASGKRDLLLRGHMPRPSDTKFVAPQMHIEGCIAEGFRVFIFRRPDVVVDVPEATGLKSLSDSELAQALTAAQHTGLLESDEERLPDERALEHPQLVSVLTGQDFRPVILNIEQNQPQLRALNVIRLSRTAEAWTATLDADLQIDSGMVDTLRFDLPANWVGPFEISPAMPWSLETVIGENRRQLVLRPESPLEHSVRLQISGPLSITAGQHASAPDVRLVGAIRQSRFLLLPRRLENQQLAWTTRGLVPRSLPESMVTIVAEPSLYRTYQMVGDHCRADLRSIESSAESPQVRLVDIDWLWNINGESRGVAAFDIDPAGATSCELKLPEDGHLVQVQVDSVPAQLALLGENRWNVWLGDNKLPRHLEVIFVVNHSSPDGKGLSLSAPALVDLPVQSHPLDALVPRCGGTWCAGSKYISFTTSASTGAFGIGGSLARCRQQFDARRIPG